MNLTLHLTEFCNMDCAYCVNEKSRRRMSEEVMYAACDLAFSKGSGAGICFFGGEPLLEKELIYKALDYCESKAAETGKKFSCRMTTNGTLLDEDIIRRSVKAGMEIGISFDGLAQDVCRRYTGGGATFADTEKSARMLLKQIPSAYAMLTLAPQAAEQYAASVKYLHDLGFCRVTATIAYGKRVSWTDERLEVLKKQMNLIADCYSGWFEKGERFFFSPFDSKIRECISGFNPAERCHLGLRQMPVAVDGKLYPCTQFMGDESYCLGDVFSGVNVAKQTEIAMRTAMPEQCGECEINKRCTNSCGCMNRLETGSESRVSPLQCTYERMLIDICDRMAEELFGKCPEKFRSRFA